MCDGIVLYTDGSFRQNVAGWGVHGYIYNNIPMSTKIDAKQLPTSSGYADVGLDKSCTVIEYIDSFGKVEGKQTNNTAELKAAIEGLKLAHASEAKKAVMLIDSEYVRKGLEHWMKTWIKNNWLTGDGQPVKNKELFIELKELKDSWLAKGNVLELKWIKGHSGDTGNDKADENAVKGGKGTDQATTNSLKGSNASLVDDVSISVDAKKVEKIKKIPISPLPFEVRLIFPVDRDRKPNSTYYTYTLGKMHGAGARPKDSTKDKLAKADLLLGRRISDAAFCVYKANEPDEYFEKLIGLHTKIYGTDISQLGIINLTNACRAINRQRIESMEENAFIHLDDIKVLATPEMALISRTLDPPRMAPEAVNMLGILEDQLNRYLENKLGESVIRIDITDHFYEEVVSGKKTVTKLKKAITQNTELLKIPTKLNNKKYDLRLMLGFDIPGRNQLNRIASEGVKVEVLLSPVGPLAYSYSTIIATESGAAVYSAPYFQFILPKSG